MKTTNLELGSIRLDGDTQPREAINDEVVNEYAEAMRLGAQFPPVEVYHDGASYWLVDGFHRLHAARLAGKAEIAALIKTGVQADAQWASLAANKTHGLRRSNADKAKAVRKALKLKWDLSDRAIGQHVGVNNSTVAHYRDLVVEQCSQSRVEIRHVNLRTGRDGKTYNIEKIRSRASKQREFRISPQAMLPVRGHSEPQPKKPCNMPCNPVMGACTLFELFDRDYLLKLIAELQTLLHREDNGHGRPQD